MRKPSTLTALCALLAVLAASCSRDPQKLKVQYVQSGDQYLAKKDVAEAIVQYRKAVAQDASFGEARLKLADAYASTGDFRNALREYIRAADLMPKNIEAQLRAGTGLLTAGQYPDAKARAIAALALDPKNVTGLILMGNALAGVRDLDGAVTQVEEAIDADPRRTLTYANLGALEMARGNRDAARDAFARAVASDPKSSQAHLAMANFYWAANERDKAEFELKAAETADPKSTVVNRALAVFYMMGGRNDEAEKYLKAYATQSPDFDPKLLLADFYMLHNNAAGVKGVLEPLLGVKAAFIPAKLRLAAVAFAGGDRPLAYKTLEEVLTREPKNELALLEKSRFLMIDQKPAEALELATTVVTRNPKSIAGHFARGAALRETAVTDEAIQEFQEVLRLSPSAVPALLQISALNLGRGDPRAAIDFLGQAVKLKPQLGVAHMLLARAFLATGNVAGAEREIQGLIKGSPDSPEVQLVLADLYWAKRDVPHARTAYTRVLQLRDGSSEALAGLIRADIAQNRPDAAKARIDAQMTKTPNDAALLLLAGNTYFAAGDKRGAETMYQRSVQANPANFQAYRTLAGLYVSEQRLEDARQKYEELRKQQPKAWVWASTMIGTILTLQGKPDEGRKEFEHVLAVDPNMPVAANNIAWQDAQGNRNLDMALQLAQVAKAKLPNSAEVNDTLGWVYYRKGLATLAITSLEQASRQNPTNPSVHYRLGMAYLKNGDQDKARGALQEALKLNSMFREAEDAKRALSTIKG
ncbi:MAG: tetratricopeptide repeat protein [Acidobacteria bacterium]|nr:tetratricopeptide repeat protein [Acidobacteriota bacterium]